MNKHLLACFAVLMSFTGCVKSDIKRDFYVTTPQSHMMSFHECPDFISNPDAPLQSLIIACNAGKFEHYMIYFEDVNDTLHAIRVSSKHGFATLWLDSDKNICLLDFFCVDDRYVYSDFLESFMSEFVAIENKDEYSFGQCVFDDLLESWD